MLSFSIAYCHMLTLHSKLDFSRLEGKGNADSPSESLQTEHMAGSKQAPGHPRLLFPSHPICMQILSSLPSQVRLLLSILRIVELPPHTGQHTL